MIHDIYWLGANAFASLTVLGIVVIGPIWVICAIWDHFHPPKPYADDDIRRFGGGL